MWKNKNLERIQSRTEVRQALIELRQEIRAEEQRKALARELAGDFSVFTDLLRDGDPKVRKNAVRILGEMECDDLRELIWNAYLQEQTLFVRADYLKAMEHLNCKKLLPEMKRRMKELNAAKDAPEQEKHLRAERSALQTLLLKWEKPGRHRFDGYGKLQDVILLTNRRYREVTAEQLRETEIRMLSGGLRVRTEQLRRILQIRTWSEMLFPLPRHPVQADNPQAAAKALAAPLLRFLMQNHEGEPPFYFRLDLRGVRVPEQKTELLHRLSAALETESGRRLINTTSDYELELRLVADKNGRFVPMVRLGTIPDRRFAYRRESLATSIAPVNAALIMALAREYLKETAQVLDPFCGTGTMLIERRKLMPSGSMYGLDILEDAILKARRNTELADLVVNYINRDYFDFRHTYAFDEIVTNMPGTGRTRDPEEVRSLYLRFLEKSEELLSAEAVLVLYTPELALLKSCISQVRHFRIRRECILNERDGSGLLIVEYRRELADGMA